MLIKLNNLADKKKVSLNEKLSTFLSTWLWGEKEKKIFFGAISKRLSICQKGFMKETRP